MSKEIAKMNAAQTNADNNLRCDLCGSTDNVRTTFNYRVINGRMMPSGSLVCGECIKKKTWAAPLIWTGIVIAFFVLTLLFTALLILLFPGA